MSSLRLLDILKLTFRVLQFKFEQRKLTTSTTVVVGTSKGRVRGVKRISIWGQEYYSFERIPYAKPPLRELRFRAPVPAEAWTQILDCTGPAEKPLQSNAVYFRKFKGSEDCLYLNVFTKNLNPEHAMPVMVWIYGGGFQIGEASRDMYSPDYFMSKDVVLVTIAYRLGPFGFLSMADPDVNVPGNAGIKDQILSLKWVQQNIAKFGGDPNNVTVFGESAGGASTHLCMVSEQGQGLMHKAIVMSGSVICPWANLPDNRWAHRLAQHLGYRAEDNDALIYDFLLHADGTDLIRAAAAILTKEEKHNRILFAFGPVVEPYHTDQCILSKDPYVAMNETWSHQIPLLIGGTSFEGLLFYHEVMRRPATLSEVDSGENLLPPDLDVPRHSEQAQQFARLLKTAYFGGEECGPDTKMEFLELESYREFWHPIYRTALARLRADSAPTYIYRFDYDSKEGNGIRNVLCGRDIRGCCHGDDICYLFLAMFSYKAPHDSTECHIIRTMIDIWTSFATAGNPNCQMLHDVRFEPLSPEAATDKAALKCLNIAEKLEFIELPEMQKMDVWNSFYAADKL